MDSLRSCYKSYMRLYPDEPDKLTPGRWVWAPEGAQPLPFATAFCSSKYDPNDWLLQGVGEVRSIPGPASGRVSPRYTGRHFCGAPALWQQGSPLDLEGTPAVDAEGVPLCCDAGPALGGIGVGGIGAATDWTGADLWLRPEELTGFAEGDTVPSWPPAPLTPRRGDYLQGWPGKYQTDADTGRGGILLSALGFNSTQYRFSPGLPTPEDWTAFVVARTRRAGVSGPYLSSDGQLDVWLDCDALGLRVYKNAAVLTEVTDGLSPELGKLLLLGTRSEGGQWVCERAGVQTAAGSGVPMPFDLRRLSVSTAEGSTGDVWVSEVIVYPRALSDAERAAVWSYLESKYQESDMLPTGMIVPFAGSAVPSGYLLCDGSAVSRTTYADLFAALGTTWGAGDGSMTFGLPDLRDRVPVGTSPGGLGTDRPTARVLGAGGGEEAHQLTQAELPNVNFGVSDPGHQHGTQSGANFDGENGNTGGTSAGNPGGDSGANETNSSATGIGVQSGGTDTPHNSMQPFAVMQWIIKT